jgi:hypothetical protein
MARQMEGSQKNETGEDDGALAPPPPPPPPPVRDPNMDDGAFYGAVTQTSETAGPRTQDGRATALAIVFDENLEDLSEVALSDVALQGNQTDTSGQNQALTVSTNVGSNITVTTGASVAVADVYEDTAQHRETDVRNGVTTNIPYISTHEDVVLVSKDSVPVGGVALDSPNLDASQGITSLPLPHINVLVTDFEAVRLGLIALQKINPTLGIASAKALASIPIADLERLKSNPAKFADKTTSPDGLLTYGRWTNGYALGIDATLEGVLLRSEIIKLSGFQSEHVIVGNLSPFYSTTLAKYDFVGGTRSTSSISTELGLGLTAASILFDFSLGYGSLEGTLVHNSVTYSLLGDLVQFGTIFSGFGGIATSSAGIFPADFRGFFSGSSAQSASATAPPGLGLTYGVYTPNGIAGVAAFSLRGSGDSQLRLLPTGSVVGLSHYFELTDGTLSSSSYLYNVGGSNTGVLSGNLVTSFRTSDPGDRCSGLTCTFDRIGTTGASSVATVDLTGPPAFNPETNSQVATGAHTQLGVNWARFSPGYRSRSSTNYIEKGSAHIISFKNPTVHSNLPSAGTGVYSAIRGGTKPTMLFATSGVVQSEVVGNLTTANITIDFSTGAANAAFAGSFPDGGSGGTFTLAGINSTAFSSSTFTYMPLAGKVFSGQISNTAGSGCSSSGCTLTGRTDMQIVGAAAQGVGGVFDATAVTSAGGPPVFGVSGTYLVEPDLNLLNYNYSGTGILGEGIQ